MMREALLEFGLKLNDLVAGFAGGVVSSLVMRNTSPWQAVASVLVGTLTANYLAEHARSVLGLGEGAAFIVGLTAMVTMNGVIEAAKRWRPGQPGNGGPPHA